MGIGLLARKRRAGHAGQIRSQFAVDPFAADPYPKENTILRQSSSPGFINRSMSTLTTKTTELHFRSPRLNDSRPIRDLVEHVQGSTSDLAFANLYLLRNKYHITLCLKNDFLFRYYNGKKRLCGYGFPVGSGNWKSALRAILDDAEKREILPSFCMLSRDQAEMLDCFCPGRFVFSSDPGDSDYLYDRESLAKMTGRSFHRKRNFIARFESQYPDWRFVPLDSNNAKDAMAVATEWLDHHDPFGEDLVLEYSAIKEACDYFDDLDLSGGLIYVGQKPCAMAFTSRISENALDIHYEKALKNFQGAYPLLNRELARRRSESYINMEEDLNFSGLRTAKLSYFPKILYQRFNATLKEYGI